MPTRPASYGHDTVDLSPPRPALEGTVEAGVTIIGAGYCGLSTALYLKRARPDLRDLLLERQSALTGLFFVNRTAFPWPPAPRRTLAGSAIHGTLTLADRAARRRVAQVAERGGALPAD